MTHPLTDDLAENIAPEAQWAGDIGDTVFRHSDMRAAYDKGIQACIDWLHDYPWRGRTVQGLAEDLEEQLLAHKEDNQ